MVSTAIVIFREMIEIAMIVGIVLAATRDMPGRLRWILGGLAGGMSGAALVAVFAESISSSLEGIGQEIFNACILFTAATLIGWTVVWVRKHAREMTLHLRQVGQDVVQGKLPHYSLALIIGLAMLREGSEIVLFIYGMILSGQDTGSIVAGSITGITLGTIIGVALYYGLLKMPARYMLSVTSWLLLLLVAGLASQGAGYLSAAGYFSDFSQPLWDSSWLLSEDGVLGRSLHSLIGYSARPTTVELVFYVATLGILLALIFWQDGQHKKKALAAMLALFVLAIAAKPEAAFALGEIYSPNTEKGELGIEYGGSRTFDNHSENNNIQEHELGLEYGLTDRITVELAAGFGKNPGESIQMEETEIQGRFQFFEQGKYWLDSGLLLAYLSTKHDEDPDAVEAKLLLQKDTSTFTHRANIGLEQTVGAHSGGTGGPEYAFLWSSRYRHNEHFEPGFEIQGNFGQGPMLGQFNRQEHFIGPACYGHIFDHIKYEAAYLFGASKITPQGAARLLLEYELHF